MLAPRFHHTLTPSEVGQLRGPGLPEAWFPRKDHTRRPHPHFGALSKSIEFWYVMIYHVFRQIQFDNRLKAGVGVSCVVAVL